MVINMKVITQTMEKPTFCAIFPHPKNEMLFFDIETTGLSPKASSLYMIGAMYYDAISENYTLIQWFADNYKSEADIISSFLNLLEKYKYLYHFNGKMFDIPYLLNKCEKHGISLSKHCENILNDNYGRYSIDILSGIRSIKKKLNIRKANQTALEVWLGIHREDKYNGGELIKVYSKYMQDLLMKPEKAAESEHLLLLHNKDDIGGMLEVASILNFKTLFTDFKISSKNIKEIKYTENGKIIITFIHNLHLPRTTEIKITYPKSLLFDNDSSKMGFNSTPENSLHNTEIFPTALNISETEGSLEIPILQGILYHFYKNYKDYYYIPELDTAIHKSVIHTYNKEKIKKATRNTCYQKQEGFFIPSPSKQTADCQREIYKYSIKDQLFFYRLSPNDLELTNTNATSFWCNIISDALKF